MVYREERYVRDLRLHPQGWGCGPHNPRGVELQVRKDKGKIEEVNHLLRFNEMRRSTGIGHTRWATHGAPTMEEARLLAEKLNAPFLKVLSPEAIEESIEKAKMSERPKLRDGAKELAEYINKKILN